MRSTTVAILAALSGCVAPTAQPTGNVAATPVTAGPSVAAPAPEIAKAELFDNESTTWTEPNILQPDNNGIRTLDVKLAKMKIPGYPGTTGNVELRSYNGVEGAPPVGPTIVIEAKDLDKKLKIKLTNNLAQEPNNCQPNGHNNPGCNNYTNLHTHGLHVSPDAPADDVFKVIKPNESTVYEYDLQYGPPGAQKKHYPGTFWYHAHRHGSTALQLASSMAGALIIKGDIDELDGVKQAKERLFVLQQLAFDASGKIEKFSDLRANWLGSAPGNGPKKFTTINGTVKPVIELKKKQVERWRFVDAGIFDVLDIALVDKDTKPAGTLRQIAIDGITLKAVTDLTEVRLGPGYRTDLLVQAPDQEGVYYLYKKQASFRLAATDPSAKADEPAPDQILAIVKVEGDCTGTCFSTLLRAGAPLPFPFPDLPPPPAEATVRNIKFSMPNQINGAPHNHMEVNQCLKLDAVEEWRLEAVSGVHPFHIHVNAFQVIRDGKPAEWRDTLIVTSSAPQTIRTRYETFTGTFVLHCHNLFHEDTGMMQNVQINLTGKDCKMPHHM